VEQEEALLLLGQEGQEEVVDDLVHGQLEPQGQLELKKPVWLRVTEKCGGDVLLEVDWLVDDDTPMRLYTHSN
jgi:hypothetical protein